MCVEEDRKEDGMDTPGFASPIRAYRQSVCEMRKSSDCHPAGPAVPYVAGGPVGPDV